MDPNNQLGDPNRNIPIGGGALGGGNAPLGASDPLASGGGLGLAGS